MNAAALVRSFVAAAALTGAAAQAQPATTTAATTNVGPGRIVCKASGPCSLEIGSPVSLRYTIDVSALQAADKERLTQRCTAKATPCVATVTGTETKTDVKAISIRFYN